MVRLLFCVFDSKVGVYSPPFCALTKGEAIRSFSDAVADDKLPFKRHPGDYRLVFLGEFDDVSGRLGSVATPEPLLGADEVSG